MQTISVGSSELDTIFKSSDIPPSDPNYHPNYLTHTIQTFGDDRVILNVRVYLGKQSKEVIRNLDLVVQVKVGRGGWQNLNPPTSDQVCWWLSLEQVSTGSELHFRYRYAQSSWQVIAPLTDLDSMYDTIYIPSQVYTWKHEPPRFTHAKVLLESTLEGLLCGYKNGRFAPKDQQDLLYDPIARRILKTKIPEQLSEWQIDELMAPVCSSVADRTHLDPKFNYLTYNAVDIDWQIGNSYDLQRLIDRFYGLGIQLVPDLIFAHQVRSPFAGSLDAIEDIEDRSHKQKVFVDDCPYLFRDYGTWMFRLSDYHLRQVLIEKIVGFVLKCNLKMIRIDFVDGLILQYDNRQENWASIFITELKAALKQAKPDLVILGETFEVAHYLEVKSFIDVFYAPIGFSIIEEVYFPPSQRDYLPYTDVCCLAEHLNQALQSKRREAYYAQLHDETWFCEHITMGRPCVPWAYGVKPAQLAKNKGQELIHLGLLSPVKLLDYVRRTVRNAEALTMFSATLRYMFLPEVDSLGLGALDHPELWKVQWDGVNPQQIADWQQTGLTTQDILWHHDQHRRDMIRLRQIFRTYSKVDENAYQPLVQPHVYYYDQDSSVLCLFRESLVDRQESLLIIINFGNRYFDGEYLYEIPAPNGFTGQWEVLFDGDYSYELGTILEPDEATFSNRPDSLRLRIYEFSLLVLRYAEKVLISP